MRGVVLAKMKQNYIIENYGRSINYGRKVKKRY